MQRLGSEPGFGGRAHTTRGSDVPILMHQDYTTPVNTVLCHSNADADETFILPHARLGIDASSIAVVSGHGSPGKVVAVDGMDDEAIRQAFPRDDRRQGPATSKQY